MRIYVYIYFIFYIFKYYRAHLNYSKADSKAFSRSESKDNWIDNDHDVEYKREYETEFKSDIKKAFYDENYDNYEYKSQLEAVPEVDDTDLLKWSMALDFDEYNSDWQKTAVSMPSDSISYNKYNKSKQNTLDIGYY
jgi:hypothetical protein